MSGLKLRLLRMFALWLGLAMGLATWGEAAPDAPHWERFEVMIEVEKSGDLLVTETQTMVLPASLSRQGSRRVELDRVDAIEEVQLFEDGQELAVSTRVKSDHIGIRWRHGRGGSERRQVVMRYRVKGGVRLRTNGDQIVWPALSAERAGTIQRGAVTLRVPADLDNRIQQFTSYGVPVEVRQVDSRTVSFTPRDRLGLGEGLAVKVVVPHGVLGSSMPDWQQGKEGSYRLPGVVGQIDAAVFIVFGVGLIGGALYIAAQSSQGFTINLREDGPGRFYVPAPVPRSGATLPKTVGRDARSFEGRRKRGEL